MSALAGGRLAWTDWSGDPRSAVGVAFVSLGEGIDCTTPAGKLQLHILAAFGFRAGTDSRACPSGSASGQSARKTTWTTKNSSSGDRRSWRVRTRGRERMGRVEEHRCTMDQCWSSLNAWRLEERWTQNRTPFSSFELPSLSRYAPAFAGQADMSCSAHCWLAVK